MHVTANIKARVDATLRSCIKTAEAHYGIKVKFPTVLYTKRGTTAGVADYRNWSVNYNAVLLMENIEDFITRTVPHELAHLVDHQLHPENFKGGVRMTRNGRIMRKKRDVHGQTFRAIMSVFGADNDTRCHSYNVENARTRVTTKHEWSCNDCGATMKLGPGRHRKQLVRESYRPRNKGCGWHHTSYKYVGVQGAPAPRVAEAAQTAAANRVRAGERLANTEAKKSKLDKCREMYDWTESRQWNINQFMMGANCTSAGAATYYAKIKKGG